MSKPPRVGPRPRLLPGRPAEPGRAAGWALPAGLACVAPLAMLACILFAADLWRSSGLGDQALMELGVLEAGRGRQLLGLFSRYYWFHPGPAFFYLAAVPYSLLGRHYAVVVAVTLAVHAVAAVAATLLLARLAESRAALWAWVIGLGVWLLWLHPFSLLNPWPPFVPVLALGLLLLLAAAVAAGRLDFLPAALPVATLCVQSHVALVPVVAAISALTLILAWARRRDGSARRARWVPAALGWAATVLLWLPPVLEQASRSPGNLRALAEFFARGGHEHGAWSSLQWAAGGVTVPVLATIDSTAPPGPPGSLGGVLIAVAFAGQLVVLLLGWLAGRRAGRPFLAALCALCAGAMLAAWFGTWSVRGPQLNYLVAWTQAVGLASAVALVVLLPRRGARPATRRHAGFALLVVGLALSLSVAQDFAATRARLPAALAGRLPPLRLAAAVPLSTAHNRVTDVFMLHAPYLATLTTGEPLAASLRALGCRRPRLQLDDPVGHREGPWLIPAFLVAMKKGFPDAVPDGTLPHARGAVAPPGATDCAVILAAGDQARAWQARGCRLLVDRGPGLSIAACPP